MERQQREENNDDLEYQASTGRSTTGFDDMFGLMDHHQSTNNEVPHPSVSNIFPDDPFHEFNNMKNIVVNNDGDDDDGNDVSNDIEQLEDVPLDSCWETSKEDLNTLSNHHRSLDAFLEGTDCDNKKPRYDGISTSSDGSANVSDKDDDDDEIVFMYDRKNNNSAYDMQSIIPGTSDVGACGNELGYDRNYGYENDDEDDDTVFIYGNAKEKIWNDESSGIISTESTTAAIAGTAGTATAVGGIDTPAGAVMVQGRKKRQIITIVALLLCVAVVCVLLIILAGPISASIGKRKSSSRKTNNNGQNELRDEHDQDLENKKKDDYIFNPVPTSAPVSDVVNGPSSSSSVSVSPITSTDLLIALVEKIGTVVDLDNLSTIEMKALDWMIAVDPLRNDILLLSDDDDDDDHDDNYSRTLAERYVVSLFYFAMDGPNVWERKFNFLSGTSICLWNLGSSSSSYFDGGGNAGTGSNTGTSISHVRDGIYCNDDGYVTTMSFEANGLYGTLPSQLSILSSLTYFSIPHNHVYGTIPSSLSSWINLTHFIIMENQFYGTIPTSLGGEMTLVEEQEGDENSHVGSDMIIDDSTGNTNNGTSTSTTPTPTPTTTTGWGKLQYWYASFNQFTGTIPDSIGTKWTNLIHFYSYRNSLNGTFPSSSSSSSSFSNWKEITEFDIGRNSLSGTIPSYISQWTKLTYFSVRSNKLTGMIPNSLFVSTTNSSNNSNNNTTNESTLITFDGSYNHLNGTIPTEFSTLSSLRTLHLQRTDLTGNINDIFCVPSSSWDGDDDVNGNGNDPVAVDEDDGTSSTGSTTTSDEIHSQKYVVVDCHGPDPEIVCSCCAVCCQDDLPCAG